MHPIRHRLGILFVCLVALLLAREPGHFLPRLVPSQVSHAPDGRSQQHRALVPRQGFGFGYQSAAQDYNLQPFFSYAESADLRGRGDDPSRLLPATANPDTSELNSRLNPNSFPQAARLAGPESGDGAMANPEGEAQIAAARLGGGIGGFPTGSWPSVSPNCSEVGSDRNGGWAPADAPSQSAGVKVPEPGSLWLVLIGAAIAVTLKFRT
jgi:hypothetical protein